MIKQRVTLALLMLMFVSKPLLAEPVKGPDDLLGEVSASNVLSVESFLNQYEVASISYKEVEVLGSIEEKITLRVLFGTWCHDSVREVPHIIKLVEAAANPNILLLLTAISRDKLQPEVSVARYALKYTPTIIVLKGNKELGRIIEKPESSWAVDIASLARQQ